MTRRMALALALALTTVVTFAMVATGREVGLFGGGGDGSPASAEESLATPTATSPTVEPSVTTEYIYVDEPATSEGQGQVTPSAGTAVSSESSSSQSSSADWYDDDTDEEDDEHHGEDEDEDEHHGEDEDDEQEHEEYD